ncbi:MAG: GNAT family N-acetyltransferase [Anaerolineales bacterium]
MGLPEFYNLRYELAENGFERWRFLQTWWRLYRHERHWAAPYYPAFKEALNPESNPHLKRMEPRLVFTRGVARKRGQNTIEGDLSPYLGLGVAAEATLSCALLLYDQRRPDGSAYLALLHSQNTPSGLEGLLDFAGEELAYSGARRILGPVGISPFFNSGVLTNLWNQTPPAYAAYNPPFLPELMGQVMEPGPVRHVYRLPVTAGNAPVLSGPARLEPLEVKRLANDLLYLLQVACLPLEEYPAPDVLEASFLLKSIRQWPHWGWLAKVEGRPAGFVLLQPDFSPLLQRTGGGRALWQRLVLRLLSNQPTRSGRVVFGGVAPNYRRQGIARQLWQQVIRFAQLQGWESLSVGPLPETSPAARFCTNLGGQSNQEYRLYTGDL